jgi:hypothetical protein
VTTQHIPPMVSGSLSGVKSLTVIWSRRIGILNGHWKSPPSRTAPEALQSLHRRIWLLPGPMFLSYSSLVKASRGNFSLQRLHFFGIVSFSFSYLLLVLGISAFDTIVSASRFFVSPGVLRMARVVAGTGAARGFFGGAGGTISKPFLM